MKVLSIKSYLICVMSALIPVSVQADINMLFQKPEGNYTITNLFNNASHCGVDIVGGFHTKIYSTNFGMKIYSKHDSIDPPSPNCDVGNAGEANRVIVKHLLPDGKYYYSRYLHMSHEDTEILTGYNYVSQKQFIGREGRTGYTCGVNGIHLHYEINSTINTTTPGATAGSGTPCNTGTTVAIDPSPFWGNDNNDHKILLPILSRKTDLPNINNYSVFGITQKPLYGYLNIDGTGLERVGIIARQSSSRNDATNTNTTATHQWLAESTNDFSDLYGSYAGYTTGDYLFVPYAKQSTPTANYGYPIKFSFVNEGSIIVDNDQLNSVHYKYESDNAEANKIPGYFLTAELHNGRSNDTGHWYPGVAGEYKIYVHVPEYGPTATNVVYKIKGNGVSTTLTNPINMVSNLGKWVQLKNNTKDSFKFTTSGVVAIRLSSEYGSTNYEIDNNHTVAFDAIKFVKVLESQKQSILSFVPSILAGTRNIDSHELISANNIAVGNVRFEDQDGSKLPLPDNAWIRIVPKPNQVEGNYDGINCKIIPSSYSSSYSGKFGQLFCYARSQETLNSFNDHSQKFQIVIYEQTQNQGEAGWALWNSDEQSYCHYGNDVVHGSWSTHTCSISGSSANDVSGIISGVVHFKDDNNIQIPIPNDAWIRVTPSRFQNNGDWRAINCKIQASGIFGTTSCYSSGNETEIQQAFSDNSETFQVVIFKNHIYPNEFNWNCGEDVYRYVGDGLPNGAWSNIEVNPTDFQDRSGENCTQQ